MRALLFALCSWLLLPIPALASDDNLHTLKQRLSQIDGQLERIRFYMGQPKNLAAPVKVEQVSDETLYFQSLILFERAAHFGFEMTLHYYQLPQSDPDTPYLQRTAKVLKRIQDILVAVQFEIDDRRPTPSGKRPDNGYSATDLFQDVIQTSRQISLLESIKTSPKDVVVQLTWASALLAELLESDGKERMPVLLPSIKIGKTPGDVLNLLTQIESRLWTNEVAPLTVTYANEDPSQIKPFDSFLLASLIRLKLQTLHHNQLGLDATSKVSKPSDPGRRYPFHAYQLAEVVSWQLDTYLNAP